MRLTYFIFLVLLLFPSPATAQEPKSGLSDHEKIDYYVELHKKDPANTDYIMAAATAYKKKHMFPQALSFLKKALVLEPENEEALFQTGIILSWTKKFDSALGYLDQLLALAPEHADGLLAKARVLSWKDKRLEALGLIDKVLNIAPEYTDAYVLKGRIHTWQKEYDTAQAMYKKALELNPDNKDAKRALPDIESFKGNYEPAIAGYEALRAEYPDDIDILNGFGKILSWKGDYTQAIDILNKSLKLDPLRADTIWLLSRAYRWAQRFDEGIELQKKILERDPDNFQATKDIAQLYEESKRDNEAIVWFNKALEINQDSPEIHARLGMLYSRTRKIDQAIRSLEKATVIDNNNDISNLITLGRLFSWKSRLNESIELYKKALEINPQSQDAYIGLGRTYFYDEKWELALEQMKRALEINPLNKEADYEYNRIRAFLRPTLRSRYNYYFYKDYDGSELDTKIHRHEFAQDLTWPFSSKFKAQFQYRYINESRFDTDKDRDYTITGDEYAFYIDKTLGEYFSVRAKGIAGKYRADKTDYTLQDDEFLAGYALVDFEYERLYINIIAEREALYPIFRGDDMFIKDRNSYGGSLRYELTSVLSVFGSYTYRDYYAEYERNDYVTGIILICPWLEELEFEYYFQTITNPEDLIHAGQITYRDRIGKVKYLLSYNIESSSEDDEIEHGFRALAYCNITKRIRVYARGTYSQDIKTDDDKDVYTGASAYVSYRL